MYNALVRSHLDYCDIIYHRPALNSQTNLRVMLNSLMEKVERTQYQAALVLLVHGKVLSGQNFTRNGDGKPYLTVVDASAFLSQIDKIKKNMIPSSKPQSFFIDVITLIRSRI